MVFIPTRSNPSSKGLLVGLAGLDRDGHCPDARAIPVYDIAAQRWYQQLSTGDISAWRNFYCMAGITSTKGTFEIMLYGGSFNFGGGARSYNTIHILTLPAFHWIQVQYPGEPSLYGHTCTLVGGSQILVVGGADPGVDSSDPTSPGATGQSAAYRIDQNTISTPDPWKQGMGIYDLSSLQWKNRYECKTAPYQQAPVVERY